MAFATALFTVDDRQSIPTQCTSTKQHRRRRAALVRDGLGRAAVVIILVVLVLVAVAVVAAVAAVAAMVVVVAAAAAMLMVVMVVMVVMVIVGYHG